MSYLSKKEYKLLGFLPSNKKDKMYSAVLENKKTKKIKYMDFGSRNYGNYRDITGLNLYPQLIHNDKERRRLFRSRMKHNLKDGFYSSSFFAYKYLW